MEAHPSSPLRVTVRSTVNVGVGLQKQETFAVVDAVTPVIRAWLTAIQDGPPNASRPIDREQRGE
jgi:hypothetical protein